MVKLRHDSIEKLIADRMFYLRTQLIEVSQLQMAHLLGIKHYQTISKYEIGALKPSVRRCKQMIELAEQRGKKIDYRWLRPDIF